LNVIAHQWIPSSRPTTPNRPRAKSGPRSIPPTRQRELMAAGITTLIVAGVAVSLRLYTRVRVVKTGLSPDDCWFFPLPVLFSCLSLGQEAWLFLSLFLLVLLTRWQTPTGLVTVAMAMSILMTVFVKKDIDHGLTYHVWDILQSTYHIGERLYGLLSYLTFILSVSFAKASMLVFYTRLAPQLWVRAVAYSLTAIFVESLSCRPLRGIVNETLSDVDGACDGFYPGYVAVSCLNIVMDVVILLLPVPIVIPLQIPTRQKVLLVLTFATGVFVCVVAIYRVSYIPTLEASDDYDWYAVPDMILCFLEVNAGIVCASVPALCPFFTRYFPALISSHGKRSSGGDENNGRTIGTVEQRNAERQIVKQRRHFSGSGLGPSWHEMYPVEAPDMRYHPALQNDGEEAQLWIPHHASKDSGSVTVTDGSSRT
ncbi:Satratoxin biosynthesis SC1 cluster protein 4, partial [Apiospora aurea]